MSRGHNSWRSTLVAIATAMITLVAPSTATAATPSPDGTVVCVPESLTLYSETTKEYTCFAAPRPTIDPPFPATWAHNGYQHYWCVFSETDYRGWMVRVPPYQRVDVNMPVASATWC